MRLILDECQTTDEEEDGILQRQALIDWLARQDQLLQQLRRQHRATKEAVLIQENLTAQFASQQADLQQRLRKAKDTVSVDKRCEPRDRVDVRPNILLNQNQVRPGAVEEVEPRTIADDRISHSSSQRSSSQSRKERHGKRRVASNLGDEPRSSPYDDEFLAGYADNPMSASGDGWTTWKPKLYRKFSELEHKQRERLRQVQLRRNPNFFMEEDGDDSLEQSSRCSCASLRHLVRRAVLHSTFDWVAGAILVANCVIIGWQVQYKAAHRTNSIPQVFTILDLYFAAWFVVELGLRIFTYGIQGYFFDKDWNWNWFDFVVVAFTVIETAATVGMGENTAELENVAVVRILKLIRIARVLRVIRVMRFFRAYRALRILVTAISGTIKSFIWTVLLLSVINYLFGVAFTQAGVDFEEELRNSNNIDLYWLSEIDAYYGTLFKSILTLFEASTGGIDWKQALDPLQFLDNSWLFVTLFLIFIFFVYLAVLNVVTGLFCQTAIEMAQSDHQDLVQQMLLEKQRFVRSLASLFKEWDTSKDGEITLTEFEDHLEDEKMRAFLRALEIDIEDSWTLFKLLDKDKGGSVNLDEFVDGCLRLKGPAKSMQVHQIMYENRFIGDKLISFMQICEESFQQIKSEYTTLKNGVDDKLVVMKESMLTALRAEMTSGIMQSSEAQEHRPRLQLQQASPASTLRHVAWGDWSTSIRAKPPLGIEV